MIENKAYDSDSLSTITEKKIVAANNYFNNNSFCNSVSSIDTSSTMVLGGNVRRDGKQSEDSRFTAFKGVRLDLCMRMPYYWLAIC